MPNLPTGWAVGGVEAVKKAAPVKAEKKEKVRGKLRHQLPKGAVAGKPFTEDVRGFAVIFYKLMEVALSSSSIRFTLQPDRWLPLRQRSSYIATMGKKKGANLSMGTGMTQGSTTPATSLVGGATGGGGKSKKGKKK